MLFVIQASQDKKSVDVGANLFIGNLDPVRFSFFLFSFFFPLFFISGVRCPCLKLQHAV